MGYKPRSSFVLTLALSTAIMSPDCLAQRARARIEPVPGEARAGVMDAIETSRAKSGVEEGPQSQFRAVERFRPHFGRLEAHRLRPKHGPEYTNKLNELDDSFSRVTAGLPPMISPGEMTWLSKYEIVIWLVKTSGCVALVSGMIAINKSVSELMTRGQVDIQVAFDNAARANTRAEVGMAGLCEQMAACTNGAIIVCPSVTQPQR